MLQHYRRNKYVEFPRYETPSSEKLTIPNQAFTIQELVAKHAQGMDSVSSVHTPIFPFDDVDFDTPSIESIMQLDPVERAEYAEQLKQVNLQQLDLLEEIKKREAGKLQLEKAKSEASSQKDEAGTASSVD